MVTDNVTYISPLGLGFTALMCLLLLILPRKYALVPVIILTCYMTMGERVIVAGLNFTMLRILTLVGWVRILIRGELKSVKLNAIDKVLIWWTLSSIIAYVLLWQTYDALKYKFGLAYNAIGMYFLFRALVQSLDDVIRVFRLTALLIAPLAAIMFLEKMTGVNSFAMFGGVSSRTVIREGVLRCQGPFAHPILAGTFGATLFPFFAALWWQRGFNRFLCILGVASSAIITLTAGSSGPVGAYLAAVAALLLWRFRRHLWKVRRGAVLTLLLLEIVMQSHVWFLLGRISFFAGSDAWHRAYLIDRAIANFSDWWLIGTKSTEAWGFSLWDVTNQFVAEGANGGLVTLVLFITIIVRCFRGVGRSIRASEENDPRRVQLCIWAMGAALFAHVITYLAVSYFDQNMLNWYLLLAMIATTSGLFLDTKLQIPVGVPRTSRAEWPLVGREIRTPSCVR